MSNPAHKVSVRASAVKELALHGPSNTIEMLFRETARTVRRLGIGVGPRVRGFSKVSRTQAGRPAVHDIIRWLNGLELTDKYADDVLLLKRLHATLRARCYSDVVKAVEG